jgi:hypothetical protein
MINKYRHLYLKVFTLGLTLSFLINACKSINIYASNVSYTPCTTSNYKLFKEKGYYDYIGVIGKNENIHMSLYHNNNIIKGSYFYDKFQNEIKLSGKIVAKSILINQLDKNGSITAIFKGKIGNDDSIFGSLYNIKTHKNSLFKINLQAVLSGVEFGHRYTNAGINNDITVENFAKQFQAYVKSSQKDKISNLISYPINVYINGKRISILNKQQFIKNYNNIFNNGFKNVIISSYPQYMFSNYQGVMFGSGLKNVWINIDSNNNLMITAINN